jgi:hypothetical protein
MAESATVTIPNPPRAIRMPEPATRAAMRAR